MKIQDKLFKDFKDVSRDLRGVSKKVCTYQKLKKAKKEIFEKIRSAEKENPTELSKRLRIEDHDLVDEIIRLVKENKLAEKNAFCWLSAKFGSLHWKVMPTNKKREVLYCLRSKIGGYFCEIHKREHKKFKGRYLLK